MRTTCFIVSLLALLMWSQPTLASDLEAPEGWNQEQVTGPEAHAQRFLDLMMQGKLDPAFKALLGNSKSDSLDKLKFEIYRNYQKYGSPVRYEKVLDQTMGHSLMRLRYVLQFNTVPMMFDIYYYHNGKSWRLRTFTYSMNIKQMFQQ